MEHAARLPSRRAAGTRRPPARWLPTPAFAVAVAVFGAAACSADDFASVAERARRMANHRKTTAGERTAMVGELAEFSTWPAASQIITVGLAAADAEPRTAARSALVSLAADKRIKSSLMASYRREVDRGSGLAAELAVVLLAVEREQPEGEFRLLLERMPPPAMLATCGAICGAAVRPGDATAVAALTSYATTRCFAGSLACRRAVVGTLTQIPSLAAMQALVDLLGSVSGEARGDIMATFARVSGKAHAADQNSLQAWLDAHRDELGKLALASPEHPVLVDDAAADGGADDRQAAYYGIPIYADRAVFVIDVSSSMKGPPLEAAQQELRSAILRLPDTSMFAVLAFESRVAAWQRHLVPASEANKRAATEFVAGLRAQGGTATSDALQAAFAFDADAIFFLSDGEPSAGKIRDPAAIVTMVAQLNAGRAISVNAISIMGGAQFLEVLARANQGSFRAIER